MSPYSENDTIAALATAHGPAALAIIRVSGPDALQICAALFTGRRRINLKRADRYHGMLVEPEVGCGEAAEVYDEVILHTYPAPHSFTGEDMAEINCHGGLLVVERLLGLLLRRGARLAAPGEFSKRAFLNGKLDLLQAEAVADIIAAPSRRALALSLAQLHGDISLKINKLSDYLRTSCALLELELDFSEGEVLADRAQLEEKLNEAAGELRTILAGYHYGQLLREGVGVVLAGKVNVGKSTLMNRLLRRDRAIVSRLPGTTRDTLEEGLRLGGYLFHLTDTAGIRAAADEIEREGVARTLAAISSADLLLLIFDASTPLDDEDREIIELGRGRPAGSTLYLFNKCDLLPEPEKFTPPPIAAVEYLLALSVRTGAGVEELERRMIARVERERPEGEGVTITRLRHHDALRRAEYHLEQARQSLSEERSGEFIALDLRMALAAAGELTGEVRSADILEDIFSTFCIGK